MINAGDYNKKISIYQIEEKEDNDGFIAKKKVIVLEAFSKIKTTKGYTLIANGSDFEKAYTNFTIRYSKKLKKHITIQIEMYMWNTKIRSILLNI